MNHRHNTRWLRDDLLRAFAKGIILAALVSGSLVAIFPLYSLGDGIVASGSNTPITGHSIANVSSTSKTGITFLNSSPFRPTDWRFTSFPYSAIGDSLVSVDKDSDGLHISAKNQILFLGYRLNLPVALLESLNFTMTIECESGDILVFLVASWFQCDIHRYDSVVQQLTAPTAQTMTLPLSGKQLNHSTASSTWMATFSAIFEIDIAEQAEFTIKSVQLSGVASRPLTPITVNVFGSDYELLFENPSFEHCTIMPLLNLTDDSTPGFALLYPQRINEIVYLPTGKYLCTPGWQYIGDAKTYEPFNFTITSDRSAHVNFTLPTTRLYLDVPSIGKTFLWISLAADRFYPVYSTDLSSPLPEFVYLPDDVRVVDIMINVPNANNLQYLDYSKCAVLINLNHTYTLTVHWNVLPFAGFVLTMGQVFLITFTISLLIVVIASIQRAATPKPIFPILRDPRVISALCFILGYLIPWPSSVIQSVDYGVVNESREYYIIMLISRMTVRSNDCSTIVPIDLGLGDILFWLMFICWLPLVVILYDLLVKRLNPRVLIFVYLPAGVFGAINTIISLSRFPVGPMLLFVAIVIQLYLLIKGEASLG